MQYTCSSEQLKVDKYSYQILLLLRTISFKTTYGSFRFTRELTVKRIDDDERFNAVRVGGSRLICPYFQHHLPKIKKKLCGFFFAQSISCCE